MTTPKAEAMAKAREISRELLGTHERYERIRQDLIAILEPLLSAQKERDELKAKLLKSEAVINAAIDVNTFVKFNEYPRFGTDPFQVLTMKMDKLDTVLRAFLAKQGEK